MVLNAKRNLAVCLFATAVLDGCSRAPARPHAERPPPVVVPPTTAKTAPAPEPLEPYRANLGRGTEIYLPSTFTAPNAKYDLIVHFHGEGRFQEANVDRAKLDVAVVSINLGMGTEPYAKAFKSPGAFDHLLALAQAEIEKSGRGGEGAHLGRLALTAWSAGFSSIAQVLDEDRAARVDAILLADGFFTSFTDVKKRTVNDQGLTKFVRFAEAAERGDKLFAITHTTIPTGPYPSVQECTARLLELLSLPKVPADGVGPLGMKRTYTADRGSFHVYGFEGYTAGDHVKQLHAMGDTLLPLLKARWR